MEELQIITFENGIACLTPAASQKLAEFERQVKAIKQAEDELKARILAEFETHNLLKVDTDDLSITYVGETYRETLDSKKLKEEQESLYNQYVKISPVKASLRIKVK